jgi:hypothetical protein
MSTRYSHTIAITIAVGCAVSPLASAADAPSGSVLTSAQSRACAVQSRGSYGFQCFGSAFTGAVAEPVTFVGTVDGDANGFYEGYGTFSSSAGSASTHVAGTATFGNECFGHINYTTNEIILPSGGKIPLPPISFDFISVDNNSEILGTGVAAAGVTGDQVPRLTCRLIKLHP